MRGRWRGRNVRKERKKRNGRRENRGMVGGFK